MLCEHCYWNSANDFFEGEFDAKTGAWREICVQHVVFYPRAKACPQF
jgi:hypothetical protein